MTILNSKQAGDISVPLQQALNALDALQSIHPFISLAIVAFKAVVGLEIKRRANDKRIGAVYAAILDMLSVLFELGDIKDDDRPDPNGGTMKGRLTENLTSAREEIKTAANSIDKYSKTKFIVKVIKSNQWEDQLVGHIQTFGKRKKSLKFALHIQTVVVVNKIQAQITDVTIMLSQVLKNQTTKEKELQEAIDKNGGVNAVIQRDDVLLELTTKYEDKDAVDKTNSVVKGKDAQKTIDAGLRMELSTSVKELLKANENLFLKKFDAQTTQISQAMERSADRVIQTLSKGPYQRVEDPDIRALWKEERWRSNVKARLFILSLHDYFTTQRGPAETDNEQGFREDSSKLTFIGRDHPEAWTLEYMGGAHLTSIQDAIDDDASGFVSINEVNEFTRQKPNDMSLPIWITYWAAGWGVDSKVYEKKIRGLVKQMRTLRYGVLDDDKDSVSTVCTISKAYGIANIPDIRTFHAVNAPQYLLNQFEYIEKLSTYDDEDDEDNPDLLQMAEAHRSKNEERITKNLEDIKYEIDGPAAVLAVCGPGRIDRHLLPLLYILLKRHAQIIKLCKEYILDPRELELASASLDVVTTEVYNRVSNLKAVFTQQRLDLDRTFEFYCNGIYDKLYRYWYRDNDSDSDSEAEEVSDSDDAVPSDALLQLVDPPRNPKGEDTDIEANRDAEDKDDEAEETEGGNGVVESEGGDEVAESEVVDGSGAEEPEETSPGTPTTVAEDVVPLSVDLLRFPATKAEKEAIEALEAVVKEAAEKAAKEAEEKEAEEAEGTDNGEDGGSVKDEGPLVPKTVEQRLESLESDMKGLIKSLETLSENMKEVLRRLPPKRR
ncbi:hypothetical protein FRB96_006390 [Tulasnella sp. 330]|nr:hypothetical protein FRB96_006390 [Tulasnella sp. 330]